MIRCALATLGPILQMAYVPADFDAALDYWIGVVGVGPFFLLDHVVLADVTYRGDPTTIDITVAIGYWGDMQIELIRQNNDAPSIYRRWTDAGRSGLHHVMVAVDDIAAARRVCVDAGASVELEGGTPNGNRFLYVDPGASDGMLLEVVQFPPANRARSAHMQQAAVSWDGSRPIRPFPIPGETST